MVGKQTLKAFAALAVIAFSLFAVVQTSEPYAEETVVDDMSSVRPVEKVAFLQLCGGGADGGGGRKRELGETDTCDTVDMIRSVHADC